MGVSVCICIIYMYCFLLLALLLFAGRSERSRPQWPDQGVSSLPDPGQGLMVRGAIPHLKLIYYQYELALGLYLLDWWEKAVFYIVALPLIGVLVYSLVRIISLPFRID